MDFFYLIVCMLRMLIDGDRNPKYLQKFEQTVPTNFTAPKLVCPESSDIRLTGTCRLNTRQVKVLKTEYFKIKIELNMTTWMASVKISFFSYNSPVKNVFCRNITLLQGHVLFQVGQVVILCVLVDLWAVKVYADAVFWKVWGFFFFFKLKLLISMAHLKTRGHYNLLPLKYAQNLFFSFICMENRFWLKIHAFLNVIKNSFKQVTVAGLLLYP